MTSDSDVSVAATTCAEKVRNAYASGRRPTRTYARDAKRSATAACNGSSARLLAREIPM